MPIKHEFTLSAVLLGVLIAIVFGAANAFLGLKVGMTVSASIPAAVISMGILRGVLNRGTIHENNIVQTIGSSGEALAAGVVFTVPALFILRLTPGYLEIALWGGIGGLLGVLMMVPMRHYLIVEEHGRLMYPEGVACAEVLEAGERGGALARTVFWGLGLSAAYQILRGLGCWRNTAEIGLARLRTMATLDASPALLGVGYIIGPRIAACMLAGATLGWFVIIPATSFFGAVQFGPTLERTTIPGPVITTEPAGNHARVWSAEQEYRRATVLLTFEVQTPLDATSSGLEIDFPESWGVDAALAGGVAAGDVSYEVRCERMQSKLVLDRLAPSPAKVRTSIRPGWVAVAIHGVTTPTGEADTVIRVTTFNGAGRPADQIEIRDVRAVLRNRACTSTGRYPLPCRSPAS